MFEYIIINPENFTRVAIASALNLYGAEGWEHYLSDPRGNLYLKRTVAPSVDMNVVNPEVIAAAVKDGPKLSPPLARPLPTPKKSK